MKSNKSSFYISEEIWRREAKKEFGSRKALEWNSSFDLCSSEIFLDKIFGSLTHHELIPENKEKLLIKCHSCELMKKSSIASCQAHAGIIWGIMESVFQTKLRLTFPIKLEKYCTIELQLNS